MELRRIAGWIAGMGLALVVAAPAAAAGPTVSVRVEGATGTLLERTTVTLSGDAVPGGACPGTSAGAAIEAATAGNWDRAPGGFTSQILGERHGFPSPDYWAEWVDGGAGYKRGAGVCTDLLKDGDEVLMLVDDLQGSEGSTTELPLDLEGVPATASTGATITVTVVGYKTVTQYGDPGDGVRTPIAGATVSGGGLSATTGADGTAQIELRVPGTYTFKAAKAGSIVSARETVTVSDAPRACVTSGDDGLCGTRDRRAPAASIAGIVLGKVYARGRGPRELAGTVASDPSGVKVVKLRLTRKLRGRCASFSIRRERFRRIRCSSEPSFASIGAEAKWSYLLPERLGPGRYVLEVVAIDNAFNRDPVQTGRNRVVFRVR